MWTDFRQTWTTLAALAVGLDRTCPILAALGRLLGRSLLRATTALCFGRLPRRNGALHAIEPSRGSHADCALTACARIALARAQDYAGSRVAALAALAAAAVATAAAVTAAMRHRRCDVWARGRCARSARATAVRRGAAACRARVRSPGLRRRACARGTQSVAEFERLLL